MTGVSSETFLWKRWHWNLALKNERILKGREMAKGRLGKNSILGRRQNIKKKKIVEAVLQKNLWDEVNAKYFTVSSIKPNAIIGR